MGSARGTPAVTDPMKQAGAEILAGAIEMPADDLVTLKRSRFVGSALG
jgi:hypothetical protein